MDAIIRQLDFLLQIFESDVFIHSCHDKFCEPLTKMERLFHKMVSVMTLGRFQVKNILIENLSLTSDDSKTMSVSQLLEFIENEKRDNVTARQNDADRICVQSYLVNLGTDIAKLIHKYSVERPNCIDDDVRNSEMVQDSEIDLSQGIKAEPSQSEDGETSAFISEKMKIETETLRFYESISKRKRKEKGSLATLESSYSKRAKIQHVTKQKQKKNYTEDLTRTKAKRKQKKKYKDNPKKAEVNRNSTECKIQNAYKSKYAGRARSDLSNTEETEQDGNSTRQDITTKKVVIYKQFICFLCQPKENEDAIEYKTYKDLMQHILETHVQPKQKRSIDHRTIPGKAYIECGSCEVQMTFYQKHLAHHSALVKTSLCSSYWLVHQISKHRSQIPYFIEQFKCDVEDCDFVSVSRQNLTIHCNGTHQITQVSCKFCQKTLRTRSLPVHMKICEKLVNKNERKHFPCPHCDMTFLSKISMERHEGKEHGNKQEKVLCSTCSKMLCDQNSLELHMLNIHGINITKKKLTSCAQCPWKGFNYQYNLHLKMKHPTEACTCNVCGKQFKNQIYLRNHLVCHSTEKKFKCQHCAFETTTALYLKNHSEANHLYPKKYSCPWCNYQSGFTGNMSKHKKVCKQKHSLINQNPDKASMEGHHDLKNQFVNISSHVSQPLNTSPIEIAPWRPNLQACDLKLSNQEAGKASLEVQNVTPTTVSITNANSEVHEKVSNSQHAANWGNQNKLGNQSVENSAASSQLTSGSHPSMLTPAYHNIMEPKAMTIPLNLGPDSAIGSMHDRRDTDQK